MKPTVMKASQTGSVGLPRNLSLIGNGPGAHVAVGVRVILRQPVGNRRDFGAGLAAVGPIGEPAEDLQRPRVATLACEGPAHAGAASRSSRCWGSPTRRA